MKIVYYQGLAAAGFLLCCCLCVHGAASEVGGSLHFVFSVATYTASISCHAQNGAWISFSSFHSSPFSCLILVSVQSVSTNPLMNVFFWGFSWQHIPASARWTAGREQRRIFFYLILHCQMFTFVRQWFIFRHRRGDGWSGIKREANRSLTQTRKICYWTNINAATHFW